MDDKLCDYIIENGKLYKDCPSCNSHYGRKIYYECPKFFGYRHKIIQSSCLNCRGNKKYPKNPFEGEKYFDKDIMPIKEIRILPMTKEGISPCTDIKEFFCDVMYNRGNTYYYKKNKMNTSKGTLVLFQYQAHIVGSGIYQYSSDNIDEETLNEGYLGFYKFYDESINVFKHPIPNKDLQQAVDISLNQTLQKVALTKFPKIFEMINFEKSLNVYDYIENDLYDFENEENDISMKKITVVDKFHILGIHNTVHKNNFSTIKSVEDYNKIQKSKNYVGDIGEKLIVEFEKNKLLNLGIEKEVKRISLENSSLGYDIVSYNEHGEEIHIEVKSKSQKINYIDFYITENEYENLCKDKNNFIYYVSNVSSKEPKLFILNKDKINEENLKVVLYKVSLEYEEENFGGKNVGKD